MRELQFWIPSREVSLFSLMKTVSRLGKFLKQLIDSIMPFDRKSFLMFLQKELKSFSLSLGSSSSSSVVMCLYSMLTMSDSFSAKDLSSFRLTFFLMSDLRKEPLTRT